MFVPVLVQMVILLMMNLTSFPILLCLLGRGGLGLGLLLRRRSFDLDDLLASLLYLNLTSSRRPERGGVAPLVRLLMGYQKNNLIGLNLVPSTVG